ncbi:hypothetical protein D5b_00249 [Faustovirus]|nr:hypothetical protein D5b_00249 [Faustovirus]AMN84665.1 hypothetical protein D6_00262 [Faustovirus]AMP44201.1 hypothetical protein PRJ_Dakar_00245 [Faustovirus]
MVRVSRPTSYHLPGEFHVYQDDNTKDVNTATAIKIFVVKRDFKLF